MYLRGFVCMVMFQGFCLVLIFQTMLSISGDIIMTIVRNEKTKQSNNNSNNKTGNAVTIFSRKYESGCPFLLQNTINITANLLSVIIL